MEAFAMLKLKKKKAAEEVHRLQEAKEDVAEE
jgi:hypothetical protein